MVLKVVGQMAEQHLLTSTQYMEYVTPESPDCPDCNIPLVRLTQPIKTNNYFCGHCGKVYDRIRL